MAPSRLKLTTTVMSIGLACDSGGGFQQECSRTKMSFSVSSCTGCAEACAVDTRHTSSAANPGSDLLRDLALSGAGIVRLAEFHIGQDIQEGRLVPLLQPYAQDSVEPIYMIYTNRKHLSPRIRAFRDFLEKKLAGSPWNTR